MTDAEARPNLNVKLEHDETKEQKRARLTARGVAGNTMLTAQFSAPCGLANDGELTELYNELNSTIQRTRDGGTAQADELLTAQAISLNMMFVELGRRAALNLSEYPRAAETYMRLALKAQSQCRTTLESLAEIRNPRPVAFVKQANIAHGHQQVNNGDAACQAEYNPMRAEVENGQSRLLEENANVTRLDTRAQGKTGSGDTPLEALGAVNRSRLGTGKGNRVA